MIDFESQLDDIRIKLYEETKTMEKLDIINIVNSHAHKIAEKFGITVVNMAEEEYLN